jgi:disulfide bond formation protein DsbB
MNVDTLHYLNIFLGLGAILLQIFSIAALLVLLFRPKENRKNNFLDFISKHFLRFAFFISLISTSFSLVYSEIIHFAPCYLCWFQRIFMYPLVLLFGVAFWDEDKRVVRYAMPLVCVGLAVSFYQNLGYYFGNSSGACDLSGISCYRQYVSEFGGYISIPMLALTSFFALAVILLVVHFYKRDN